MADVDAALADAELLGEITHDWSHPLLDVEPPAGERGVELMPGLWLERLPNAEAEACIEACQERGLNLEGSTRQFRQLYSFARRNVPEDAFFTFDSDQVVETALQLSRPIVPNSHCMEWSVRVLRDYVPAKKEPAAGPGTWPSVIPTQASSQTTTIGTPRSRRPAARPASSAGGSPSIPSTSS